ncbi:hypothetical protein MML48_scaffold00000259 [Holotrichia oblita]|nr:hypothetical protein MML48_scaffold00000259 [Holotrichia oblita]
MSRCKKVVLSVATKLKIIEKREKGESVGRLAQTYDKENIEEWLSSDKHQPRYEIKDDDTIAYEALESDQLSDNTDVSDKEEPLEKVSPDEALKSADCLLKFLEQENDSSYDVLAVRKIRTAIKIKTYRKRSQLLITNFFNHKLYMKNLLYVFRSSM